MLEAPLALAGCKPAPPKTSDAPLTELAECCLDGPSPLAVEDPAVEQQQNEE